MYPGNCLPVMFSFLGGYQPSQSTMVSYAFLPHPSSSCKHKWRKRTMFNIQHSPRVQPLFVVFMDAIDLLWLLVPVGLGIKVANPHIKECRALGIPEATRPNVQSCVLCSIGRLIHTTKTVRSVSKQGHLQPRYHSEARSLSRQL